MTYIHENTFAAACYGQNSVKDLEAALANGPDAGDMREWNLTAEEWIAQVKLALETKMEGRA
jgi:hypothetical protein